MRGRVSLYAGFQRIEYRSARTKAFASISPGIVNSVAQNYLLL